MVWHSHDCLYQPRDANLATLRDGMTRLKKMRFKNRRVHTFEGGFVQQHTLFVTHPNDFVGQMDVCFVAFVRDGMISRAYEYFDTGQIDRFLGRAPARRRLDDHRCEEAGKWRRINSNTWASIMWRWCVKT
jgi:hypothetical protein